MPGNRLLDFPSIAPPPRIVSLPANFAFIIYSLAIQRESSKGVVLCLLRVACVFCVPY